MGATWLLATLWRALRWPLLRGGIAAVPGVLLVSCALSPSPPSTAPASSPTNSAQLDPSGAGSRPSVSPWWLRPDQIGAHSAAGTFALKFVEITNLDLHAYYAMRSPTPGPPQVTARTTAGAWAAE